MKRKRFFIILLLLCLRIYSQESFYEIEYTINLDKLYESAKKKRDNGNLQLFDITAKTAKSISLVLLISDNISIFKERKGIMIDGHEGVETLVRAYSYEGGWMYDDFSKKLIFINSYQGKNYFVDKKLQIRNWKLTNETKTILGYKCNKATYIRTDVSNKGNNEVTAWYTNDIKMPFGPANYAGQLPGIILELDELIVVYKATSIKKIGKFKIERLKEKDIITEKQYKKEGDKVMEFYKKSN